MADDRRRADARDDRGEARLARRSCARRRLHAGSEKAVERQRERGKLLARERLEQLLDPGSFVELDRYVRHREPDFGTRWRTGRTATRSSPATARSSAARSSSSRQDFTVFGGSLSEVFAEKICKVMDLAVEVRLPGDRDQRLGRRADPGGRRLARRLRGDLLAQRAGLRRRAAALARDGAVRRRRRLLARDHRLRAHGRGLVVHVHHRPRRREDGDRRGGRRSRSSAARRRTRRSRASRTSPRPTRRRASRTRATCSRSCRRTTSSAPPYAAPADPVDREDAGARHARSRTSRPSRTT